MRQLELDENSNFELNMTELGSTLEAIEGLYQLYDTFFLLFQPVVATKDAETISGLIDCFQLMRQDFLKGTLSICRGYIADSQFQTRRIIETVATMIEILKGPEKAAIWGNLNSIEEVRAYVSNFMVFKLVKKNMSTTAVGHYESLCLFVHPSAASMAERSELQDDGTHILQLFDVRSDEDTPRLKKDLLIFLTMQFNALKELADSLKGNENFDGIAWKAASAEYHRMWCTHAKELLDSGALPELTEAFEQQMQRSRPVDPEDRN
jgi:hypothetical protein